MLHKAVADARSPRQRHHGEALWRATTSLQARLTLLVAIVVALVVGVGTYLEVRAFDRTVERDLLETAHLTAQAVADDLELSDSFDAESLHVSLHEFVEAAPTIRAISVIALENGQPVVAASTSSGERPAAIDVGRQAFQRNELMWGNQSGTIRTVAVPAVRAGRPFAAVAVTISLGSLDRFRIRGRVVALWFAPAAIVIVTLLVNLLARRLVHRPVDAIREAMQRASAGNLSARVPVVRDDELGAVASGLNDMLARMQGFNTALQERVTDATRELQLRNAELIETYQGELDLRERLARAEQMAAVGQMAANMAHQIGTPLNLISGYVQMMRAEAADDPRSIQRLQVMEEQIDRVATVVRSTLSSARRPSLQREPVSPAELVNRVGIVAGPMLHAAGVELQRKVPADVTPIFADSLQLELALLNLVSNSVDAMPDGGILAITVTLAGDTVRIELSDSGSGIDPDLLPRIFDPWVTTKPAGQGTGLGLSITREVVSSHGGTIVARSEPGLGTTFTIELPAASVSTGHRHDRV